MKEQAAQDRSHVAENDAERERLRTHVARADDDALSRAMPAGWTVAGVLAHMAFWDARVIALIDHWATGAEPSAADFEPEGDWLNDATKQLCLAIPPRDAAKLALRLAEEADAKVAALSDEMLAKIHAAGSPIDLARAGHRRQHLDEIERAPRA